MKVAGIGFRADATLENLRNALALTGGRPDALASLAAKAAQPVLIELAAELALPLIGLREEDIADEQTPTCSPRIQSRFGTGSVAEACALVAARQGPGPARSRLITPRLITADGMATAALAERLEP